MENLNDLRDDNDGLDGAAIELAHDPRRVPFEWMGALYREVKTGWFELVRPEQTTEG